MNDFYSPPPGRGIVEPTADQRALASTLHGCFIALTMEGFTEQQALQIIGMMMAANIANGGNDE